MTGIDAAVFDDWRFGVLAGYSRSTFNASGRSSSGRSDSGRRCSRRWAQGERPQHEPLHLDNLVSLIGRRFKAG